MELSAQIEAILFWKGEPLPLAELARMFSVPATEIETALAALEKTLALRGVRLMRSGEAVTLATAPEASELIARLHREELEAELGRAAMETLSIILYRAPVSRRDIEYIRGVNSSFILRNLLRRGLVERIVNEQDERVFLYRPTFELFSFLGAARVEELPEYAAVQEELSAFEAGIAAEESGEDK
jgi:segregation and condensation protein B